MESHPEEDHHGKHHEQRDHTFLCLLGAERLHLCTAGSSLLLGSVLHVLEPRAASVVDDYAQYQRGASHHECEVITVVHAVAQRLLCPRHDLHGCCRGEHCTDVDCHIEQRECCVTAVGVLRIVVQVAYHHLQVALEQTCAQRDEQQRCQHGGHGYAHIAALYTTERYS